MLQRLRPACAAGILLALTATTAATAATPDPDLPRLRAAADRVVRSGVPGIAVAVRDGDRRVRFAAGVANRRTGAPMRATDRLRIGSVTKTYTATAVLQLVGAGRLGLDDTVERWLPGVVPGGERISVRMLLDQRSGLADYTVNPKILEYVATDRVDPVELLPLGLREPPLFAPGKGWAYSNTNYLLLGLIAEAAGGEPLERQMQERIFAPLGLRRTTLAVSAPIAGRHARGYEQVGKRLVDRTAISPKWAWSAGSIVSTVDEVARFQRALLTGRLLPPAQLAEMRRTVPMGVPGEAYGLGLWRTRSFSLTVGPKQRRYRLPCGVAWGHNGNIPGYAAEAFSTADGRRQIVLLVNDSTRTPATARALSRLMGAALCG